MKLDPPEIRAVVAAAVRTALRRVRRGNGESAATPPPVRRERPDDALDLAEERLASRDLLAIDSLVRRYYALSSGVRGEEEWRRFGALFHPRATIGSGAPDAESATGLDDVPVERHVEAARAAGAVSRYAERSRTVHVVGELAVVLSSFEADDGAPREASRGVNIFNLRRAAGGAWLIQSVISRPEARAITEKSADPRPLAKRQDG